MRPDLAVLLPRDKADTGRAEAIIALGFPRIEPVLPKLLEWMQDLNWPVARVLQPFLAGIGGPLAPYLRPVLEAEDDVWKSGILCGIVAMSAELRTILRPGLERLASRPTPGEQAETLDVIAREILAY